MGTTGSNLRKWLARWRFLTFLVGGGMGLVSAVLLGFDLIAEDSWWVVWTVAQTLEYVLPLVGLIGISPDLRARTPRLARLGVAVAVVAIVLLVVNNLLLGLIGHDRPFAIVLVMVAAMILGFLVYGIACIRRGSRVVGILMILVSGLTIVFFGVIGAPVHHVYPALAGGAVAVTLLSIGYLLYTRPVFDDSDLHGNP